MKLNPVQIAQQVVNDLLALQATAQDNGQYARRDQLSDQIAGANRVLCALRGNTSQTLNEPEE